MKKLLFISLLLISFQSFSQSKEITATRIFKSPDIDGILDDEIWKNVQFTDDFTQYDPNYNTASKYKTEVKIAYDDKAIYVGAMLYDDEPNSILRQLGNRDDDLNADAFSVKFDTYNNQQDAYAFMVYASGVQYDYRYMDNTYDGVWQSKTAILNNGWSVEIRIPYSAIRFPRINEMTWGLQFTRNLRRIREISHWSLEKKDANNNLMYWGKLKGLKDINPPLRLSLTPYLVSGAEFKKDRSSGVVENSASYKFSGGLDLKYGINESFTLDMSLLPDFSQVQSDDKEKNLSAFETVYDEERPFFKEAVDLFSKQNLFYSRRIGKTPTEYYNVGGKEKIIENPSQVKLLNATKISGRTKSGLALGIFNAITDNMYATIEDSTGKKSKVLTEPLTNYNIFVIDQSLKNGSSIYLINTNVTRDNDNYPDANVTASGFDLITNNNKFEFFGNGVLSQRYMIDTNNTTNAYLMTKGYKYNVGFNKIKGKFKFYTNYFLYNNTYDPNDFGQNFTNNKKGVELSANYKIYEPHLIFKETSANLNYGKGLNYLNNKNINSQLNFNVTHGTKSFQYFWYGAWFQLENNYDFYEPRVSGRYIIWDKFTGGWFGLSSDYRKPFALDYNFNITGKQKRSNYLDWNNSITPRWRINDHLTIKHTFFYSHSQNEDGFVKNADTAIYFGNRKVKTIENEFEVKYIIVNDLSIELEARHYWSKGKYSKYNLLTNEGRLIEAPDYKGEHDFDYSNFSIDMVFSWQFAPGSILNLVWKNMIEKDDNIHINNTYKNGFKSTFDDYATKSNSVFLKVLYYIDYQSLKKKTHV